MDLDILVGEQKIEDTPVDRNYISIEFGVAQGWSLDESLNDNDDFGVFVGLGYSWKQDRFTVK